MLPGRHVAPQTLMNRRLYQSRRLSEVMTVLLRQLLRLSFLRGKGLTQHSYHQGHLKAA
jgi:hypothetical protein